MEKKFSPLRPASFRNISPGHPLKPFDYGKSNGSPFAVFYADDPVHNSGHIEILRLEQELNNLNLLEDAREIMKICLRIETLKSQLHKCKSRLYKS